MLSLTYEARPTHNIYRGGMWHRSFLSYVYHHYLFPEYEGFAIENSWRAAGQISEIREKWGVGGVQMKIKIKNKKDYQLRSMPTDPRNRKVSCVSISSF